MTPDGKTPPEFSRRDHALASTAEKQNADSSADSERQVHVDDLAKLERQMQTVWSQYIDSLDRNKPNEQVAALRENYFKLYRQYRRIREWKRVINNN